MNLDLEKHSIKLSSLNTIIEKLEYWEQITNNNEYSELLRKSEIELITKILIPIDIFKKHFEEYKNSYEYVFFLFEHEVKHVFEFQLKYLFQNGLMNSEGELLEVEKQLLMIDDFEKKTIQLYKDNLISHTKYNMSLSKSQIECFRHTEYLRLFKSNFYKDENNINGLSINSTAVEVYARHKYLKEYLLNLKNKKSKEISSSPKHDEICNVLIPKYINPSESDDLHLLINSSVTKKHITWLKSEGELLDFIENSVKLGFIKLPNGFDIFDFIEKNFKKNRANKKVKNDFFNRKQLQTVINNPRNNNDIIMFFNSR